MIANEMYNLSARVKFPNARFQSLLLIMSKIVASYSLFTKKMDSRAKQKLQGKKRKELNINVQLKPKNKRRRYVEQGMRT